MVRTRAQGSSGTQTRPHSPIFMELCSRSSLEDALSSSPDKGESPLEAIPILMESLANMWMDFVSSLYTVHHLVLLSVFEEEGDCSQATLGGKATTIVNVNL